jgi:hypothetical protein
MPTAGASRPWAGRPRLRPRRPRTRRRASFRLVQELKSSALPACLRWRAGQAGEELAPSRVSRHAARPPVVVAAGPCRQPQFVQRRLRVQHDLAATRKCEFEQAAGALRVDVDHVVLQPAVERRLRCASNCAGTRWYSASESMSGASLDRILRMQGMRRIECSGGSGRTGRIAPRRLWPKGPAHLPAPATAASAPAPAPR